MSEDTSDSEQQWSASPTAKMKTAVQRSVTALLDELAPERVLKRVERLPGAIEQHRTPSGCVLQGENAALSVSWFSEPSAEASLGELHVLLWKGQVTRPGTAPTRKGAVMVEELVLRPLEPPEQDNLWESTDGVRYDTSSLAQKCIAMLESQTTA
jgi:hypothetical protein